MKNSAPGRGFQEGPPQDLTDILADFIHFVEHKNGVEGFRPPDLLNNTAWKRSDIRSTVPPDLRFVPDPSQGDADKFPFQSTGDGPP